MPGLTSVTVQWTAPADDGLDLTSGPATQYDIRYGAETMTEVNWPTATKAAGIEHKDPAEPGITEEFVILGLRAGTQYSIALKTGDAAGNWSGLSNIVTTIPPDKNPPATTPNFRIKA